MKTPIINDLDRELMRMYPQYLEYMTENVLDPRRKARELDRAIYRLFKQLLPKWVKAHHLIWFIASGIVAIVLMLILLILI